MQSGNPTAAILVIGDEILSGRTREGNAHYLAQKLNDAGIDLREIRVISDDHNQIVGAIQEFDATLGGKYDYLFTSGGIGPTHDDITADSVAAAFGVGIDINDEALALMAARYEQFGVDLNDKKNSNRLRMARIPFGAKLIINSESAAPGFSIGATHVMAGVPEVFKAMVEWLVPQLKMGKRVVSDSVEIQRGESDVAEELGKIAAEYPDLSLGSYPFRNEQGFGTSLVIRGIDADKVAKAMAELKSRIGLA